MNFPNKTANQLVPELIEVSEKRGKELENRVKVNSIYNEFGQKSTNALKKFIELSDKRYKVVKSGNDIDAVLCSQKNEYNDLTKQILRDKFFINSEIENEGKKLQRKLKANKDCRELRQGILFKARGFTKYEIEKREKLIKSAKERNIGIFNKFNKRRGLSSPMFEEKRKKTKKVKTVINSPEGLEEKKEFFYNLMEKDKEYINEKFNQFKDFMSDLGKTHKEGDPLRLTTNKENFQYMYAIKPDNVKFLTYLNEEPVVVKPKKKVDNTVDYLKLMRYTRRGNKQWFKEELKEKSRKRLLSVKHQITRPIFTPKITSNDGASRKIQSSYVDRKPSNQLIPNFSQIDFYKDTIKTVLNEAQKIKSIDETFDNKRHTMDFFFRRTGSEGGKYELSNNFSNLNSQTAFYDHTKDECPIRESEDESASHFRNRNIKPIKSDFNKIFFDKKKDWKEEDKNIEKVKRMQEEREQKSKEFLRKVAGLPRAKNYFVDYYSRRDGDINKNIDRFSSGLQRGGLFTKKKIEKKVDEFQEKLKKREKEAQEIEKVMNKMQLEKEKELKKNEEHIYMYEKMRDNLNITNCVENEDIDLNYVFVGQKIIPHNSTNPWKDYNEFFEIVRKKDKESKAEEERKRSERKKGKKHST